ncbi:MAG: hypothetical protein ABR874_10800 [Candidatus Sulfotelmatobacter sp.]
MKRGVSISSFFPYPYLLILSVLLTFGLPMAFGQAEAGSIVGTVRDATGALVTGASIKVRSLAPVNTRSPVLPPTSTR